LAVLVKWLAVAQFCFLMDDGTVEYIPIERALKEGFCSYGKIKDVDGVISL